MYMYMYVYTHTHIYTYVYFLLLWVWKLNSDVGQAFYIKYEKCVILSPRSSICGIMKAYAWIVRM